MNGSTLALGFAGALAAGVALSRRGSASTPSLEVVRGPSPLSYKVWSEVNRISLIDSSAPPPLPSHTYFAPTEHRVPFRRSFKIEKLPGADPGTVAFLDYHILPDTNGAVYIDFYTVRPDMRGRGLGSRLIEELYLEFAGAPWIDWGKIMSSRAQSTWNRMRRDPGVPLTYGKLW